MTNRVYIKKVSPKAYKAMDALDEFIDNSSINPLSRELIRIRASQINKCLYCIDYHSRDARKLGESEYRIYALPAWQESPLFTAEEKALLAFTEAITNLSAEGVPDDVYCNVARFYNEKEIAEIIMIILTVNAWNIIGVSTQLQYKM